MFSKHFNTKFLSKHYALVPLFGAVGFGLTLSAMYTLRLAVQNPDVSWRRKTNPEPWQHRVDENGKTIRYKLHQGPASYAIGQTKYGVDAHPPERPPIEKLWAQYVAEEAASAAATAHH